MSPSIGAIFTSRSSVTDAAQPKLGSSVGKCIRSLWIPAFAGVSGLVLIGCSSPQPVEENSENIATQQPVVNLKPPATFRSTSQQQMNMVADLKTLSNSTYRTNNFRESEMNVGMSKNEFEHAVAQLGYMYRSNVFSVGAPTVIVNRTCGKDSSFETLHYYKFQYPTDQETMKLYTVAYEVSVTFGEVLVDGKCVRGLQAIPLQEIYTR